ncbi:hypothetical protein FACS1894132_05580 [Clostridia bacterium]|nr:hypothetical protein FACS1894132_05580 [Clostridia bacterium]
MSNSKLVVYTKLSPNCNKPRNHAIDTITIHCMAGNCTIETCGEIFAPTSRQASSNYGVGTDGRVGLYVDEANRSWCSSSGANDHRAVTIEVANDENKEPWHVSDKALAATIELCADICKRNGIKKLLWKADKSLIGQVDKQNMTVHRWFAAKSCPGDYLYSKHDYIADEVNKLLGVADTEKPAAPTTSSSAPPTTVVFTPYTVKVTASVLNYRAGAGTNFKVNGSVKKGEVFTIVAEAKGQGATLWGKLKSGAGWISLDYVVKR